MIYKKKYNNYNAYVKHQKSKLNKTKWIKQYDKNYEVVLQGRTNPYDLTSKSVLCLGSRLGGEVRAFIKNGAFAVGIDLNPGKDNKNVLYGDFHNLQFSSNSVDIIFSNSLDHVYDIDKMLNEIKRVLKPNGIFILEIVNGYMENGKFSDYESIRWGEINDIINLITKSGFKYHYNFHFTFPWNGKHFKFVKGD